MANYVNVAYTVADPDGGNISDCQLIFQPSDIIWSAGGRVTALQAITIDFSTGAVPPPFVRLLAMDNPNISTNWKWIFSGRMLGFKIPPRYLTVNFAAGPQQDLATLLSASTLVP